MPPAEEIPEQIGRYEIESEIGRGMMGAVYKASDPLLHRIVALKVIKLAFPVSDAERETFEKRFLAEGRIVARLSHPGIMMVHDVGRDETLGSPYLALEYLVGRTLESLLEAGEELEWRRALDVVARTARALHYAHAKGVVHRDIKPANIMLLENGAAKVMDFGVAKFEAGYGLTSTGQFIGTPLYMAPEQATNQPVDGRTDLFSLGAVAYTLLTRRHAFEADSVPLILSRVAYLDPPPPSTLRAELPSELDYVIARAMAKGPEHRYPDGATLADDVEDVLAERAPRHRADWTVPPPTGGGTLVSPAVGGGTVVSPPVPAGELVRGGTALAAAVADAPPAAREPEPPPATAATRSRKPRRPRRIAFKFLLLLIAGLAGGLLGSDFWRSRLLIGMRGEDRAAWLERMRGVLGAAGAEAARQAGATIRDWAEQAGLTPAPTPPPAAAAAPSRETPLVSAPQVVPPSPALATAAEAARLSVTLEHGSARGTFTLWLDDVELFRGRLDPGASRQALLFRRAEGGLHGVVLVAPGDHDLRVELAQPDGAATASVSEEFAPGGSRHLDARLDRTRGRLELGWR